MTTFVLGDSSPQSPATLGCSLNHIALITSNLDASIHFYSTILGMRHIFTYTIPTSDATNASTYQFVYLGYPHKTETGYQTAEEMLTKQKKTTGLLEIMYLSDPKAGSKPIVSTKVPTTLSHLGFIVPDVTATEARMLEHNVPVLKGLSEPLDFDTAKGGEVATAFGLGSEVVKGRAEAMAVLAGIGGIGFERFLLVKDPDGNLVEIQEQA